MLDLLIENGRLYPGDPGSDLTGRRGYLGIKGDRIAVLGPGAAPARAHSTIDAGGAMVCPGFIDIHTHSDYFPLADGRVESKVRQGVTTEVIGNCGYSAAPFRGQATDEIRRDAGRFGIEPDWTSTGEYLQRFERSGVAVNYCFLVGHGTLRAAVMGYDDREPTAAELRQMTIELETALEEGAFGLSSGLVYSPGIYAETGELVALARAAAARGRIYASHIRGEGVTLLEAVAEAVEIGARSGAAVQVAHLKASGRPNWGKLDRAIELLEKARNDGIDVSADRYPYEAGNTDLGSLFPSWSRDGGLERMLERLRSKDERRRIAGEIDRIDEFGPDDIMITTATEIDGYSINGKRLSAIAADWSLGPGETACELFLRNSGDVSIIMFTMDEGQAERVIGLPWVMIGSDASARAGSGPLYQGQAHPRAFGTFPRVLARLAGPGRGLTPAEAVRKMTLMPAERLSLARRGRLAVGACADVVILDPDELHDPATYGEPHQFPRGIDHVIVNGRPVVSGGEMTSERPGRVLRPGDN